MTETHTISRTGSIRVTVEWLQQHGQRVGGPFGSMGAEPAVFWTPANAPNAAPRMAIPGDTLITNGTEVWVSEA